MKVRIIRTVASHNGHPDDLVEVPMLPPDLRRSDNRLSSVGAGVKSAFGTNRRLAQICVWRASSGGNILKTRVWPWMYMFHRHISSS